MEEYIKWLENKIEVCLEDKDLQREHWAFCQALKKYRELALRQPPVMMRSEQLPCSHCGRPLKEHSKDSKLCPDKMKNFEQGN
jgi:hypothetical protein